MSSRVNLVLSGNHNNITYRLYEVLFLRSFFLIDINFVNYKISESFENISDFVFSSGYELEEKIKYFINNYNAAELIRNKQTHSFENFYNPERHGLYIKKNILI